MTVFIDDIVEYPTKEHFPEAGNPKVLYIDLDTSILYRWSDGKYAEICGVDTPLSELSQFIGDYSQNVYACSYNEDTVRNTWRAGKLNEDAEHTQCYNLDHVWPDRPKDLQAEMNRLVNAAGVWATGWRSHPAPLSEQEKEWASLDRLCHGDVLMSILSTHSNGDSYIQQQICQSFYEHWKIVSEADDWHGDFGVLFGAVFNDPRVLAARGITFSRFGSIEKKPAPVGPFPAFSWGMQYQLTSLSITYRSPEPPEEEQPLRPWGEPDGWHIPEDDTKH